MTREEIVCEMDQLLMMRSFLLMGMEKHKIDVDTALSELSKVNDETRTIVGKCGELGHEYEEVYKDGMINCKWCYTNQDPVAWRT